VGYGAGAMAPTIKRRQPHCKQRYVALMALAFQSDRCTHTVKNHLYIGNGNGTEPMSSDAGASFLLTLKPLVVAATFNQTGRDQMLQ